MDKLTRILSAIACKPVDRIPCACWLENAGGLDTDIDRVSQLTSFYNEYDWDFLVIGDWLPYDVPPPLEILTRPGEFGKLKSLRTNAGNYRKRIDTIKLVRKALGKKALIIVTIANAWATGMQITNGMLSELYSQWPNRVKKGLAVIAANTAKYAKACIRAGANGIFYRVEGATHNGLGADEYGECLRPFDIDCLNDVASDTIFNVLSIAGVDIHFEMLCDYPVHALNWNIFKNQVGLAEGKNISGKCVLGGINPDGPIADGDTIGVVEEIRDAVDETDGIGLIIGPGNPVSASVARRDLKVIRAAVER